MRIRLSHKAYMIISFNEAKDFGIKDADPTDIFWEARVYDSNGNLINYIESEMFCNKDGNCSVPLPFLKRCLKETEDLHPPKVLTIEWVKEPVLSSLTTVGV